MSDIEILEKSAQEIIEMFEVFAPPVPVESMLQNPPQGAWSKVDPTQLSGGFLNIKEKFSPRMSLARLLVRHVAGSEWGRERGLFQILQKPDMIQCFARMVIMPREMILSMIPRDRNPLTIATQFEVPESDADLRLNDLIL